MAFTIPDQGEGDSNLQSIFWQEEMEVLVAGISGRDSVLFGLGTTNGVNMNVVVSVGAVLANGTMFAVPANNVALTAADATNPRLDLVVVNASGAVAARAGTAAAFVEGVSAPKPPARTANDVVIAMVYVPANNTVVKTTQIIDKRIVAPRPVTIFRRTTADVTNNTAVAIEALNKGGSGVSIPSGLFTTGAIIRTRMGGDWLVNVAATIRFAVLFGGTVMYNDISASGVADADRRAWFVEFDLVANNNTAQSMCGHAQFGEIQTLVTAPTTGIGDVWGAAAVGEAPTPFCGSAGVDATAANRLISVQMTFNTASTSAEVISKYATVKLVA